MFVKQYDDRLYTIFCINCNVKNLKAAPEDKNDVLYNKIYDKAN
ncbi:MAG: hypothetical protein OFPI_43920 [Osedax symbiont Rs2]|nr:MAG: hypothetical protein OFPI_43920 [Osedax symbiont Rs2]